MRLMCFLSYTRFLCAMLAYVVHTKGKEIQNSEYDVVFRKFPGIKWEKYRKYRVESVLKIVKYDIHGQHLKSVHLH